MAQELADIAKGAALLSAGAALGWTALFSFVAAPVAFKHMDAGRADRMVRNIIKTGHGALGLICFVAGGASLLSGAIAGAVVSALAGAFYLMCQWTLAPRDDPRPPGARRQMKGQRVVASLLTVAGMPLMIAAAALTVLGI